MQTASAPAAKPDNLLGICHGLGELFGVDPLFLRLAFMAALLFDMEAAIVGYAVLGAMLLASAVLAGRRTAGTTLI